MADDIAAANASHEDHTPTSVPFSDFLGKPIEICIVTTSHLATLTTLTTLGIAPWRIYTCSPTNTTAQTYRGHPHPYTLKFCYATLAGGLTYEVIEPISGPSIFQDFLDSQRGSADGNGVGQGLHHIAYDCRGVSMAERVEGFEARGFECVQSGVWMGGGAFAFFEHPGARGVWWETIEVGEGWEWPRCERWFPEGVEEGGGGEEERRG